MKHNSLFLDAAYCKKTARAPIWFMRQAGRYMEEYRKLRQKFGILEIATTPELATEVCLQPILAFHFDASIIFADIILPLIPLGVKVTIADGVGPVVDEPITRLEQVNKFDTVEWQRDFAFLEKTIKMVRKELGETPLIGFSGAPFTLAGYLIEGGPSRAFLKTKSLMYREPKVWDTLMKKLTSAVITYLQGQIESGVQAVQLFDSWVGVLSPRDYETYVLPYSQEIFSALGNKRVPRIHFGTNTFGMLQEFSRVDCEVIGVDWRSPLGASRNSIGKKAIQGNLDPALLLAPFEIIKKRVDGIFNEIGSKPGFIFNLGHGILPETPRDTVQRLVEYVQSK